MAFLKEKAAVKSRVLFVSVFDNNCSRTVTLTPFLHLLDEDPLQSPCQEMSQNKASKGEGCLLSSALPAVLVSLQQSVLPT